MRWLVAGRPLPSPPAGYLPSTIPKPHPHPLPTLFGHSNSLYDYVYECGGGGLQLAGSCGLGVSLIGYLTNDWQTDLVCSVKGDSRVTVHAERCMLHRRDILPSAPRCTGPVREQWQNAHVAEWSRRNVPLCGKRMRVAVLRRPWTH